MPTRQLSAAPYSCLLCWSTNVSTKAWWSHSGIICWRNCPVDASAPESCGVWACIEGQPGGTLPLWSLWNACTSEWGANPQLKSPTVFCPFPMWNWKGGSQLIRRPLHICRFIFQLFCGRAKTAFLFGETFIFNFGVPKINIRISGVFVYSEEPIWFWSFSHCTLKAFGNSFQLWSFELCHGTVHPSPIHTCLVSHGTLFWRNAPEHPYFKLCQEASIW